MCADIETSHGDVSHRSLWPAVIGGISIGYAAGELLYFPGRSVKIYLIACEIGLPAVGRIVAYSVLAVLSILLVIAGWSLIRRKMRYLHLVYAILGVLFYSSYLAYRIRWDLYTGSPENVDLVLVINMAFAMVYPVFLIIWFSRRSVRVETASWSGMVQEPLNMYKPWKMFLNALTVLFAWTGTITCGLLLARAIECGSLMNHWSYDIRTLYIPCALMGLWGVISLVWLRLWKLLSVAALCVAGLLAVEVFIFDRFNILVEYSEWIHRGMPLMWE